MSKFFKANKTVPEKIEPVTINRILVTPPKTIQGVDGVNIDIPANINLQIKDIEPIDLTLTEWNTIKAFVIKVAKRSSKLSDIINGN